MAKGSFGAGIKQQIAAEAAPPPPDSGVVSAAMGRQPRGRRAADRAAEPRARELRKAMTLYYPAEVSITLKAMAAYEESTMQALVGEGIDLLMRARGKHPFGAR